MLRDIEGSRFSFCFSPHKVNTLSLDPVAQAIEDATSSVLYAVVFLAQLTGQVRDALEDLVNRSLFSYGVAQRTGKLSVRKPDGSHGLLPFAYIGANAPEPFKREWSGGDGNMVHHKFVVTDFNGASPRVFTGSSNMAAGGELANGDNLILIEDRKVAIAYAIEALRLFDHFHFRVRLKQGEVDTDRLTLARPPAPAMKACHVAGGAARRGLVSRRRHDEIEVERGDQAAGTGVPFRGPAPRAPAPQGRCRRALPQPSGRGRRPGGRGDGWGGCEPRRRGPPPRRHRGHRHDVGGGRGDVRRGRGGPGRRGHGRQDAAQGGAQAPADCARAFAQPARQAAQAGGQDEQPAGHGHEPAGRLAARAPARLCGLGARGGGEGCAGRAPGWRSGSTRRPRPRRGCGR